MAAPHVVVNLQDKLDRITGHWSPGIVAEANAWQVKLVTVAGRFVWHSHEVDELFLVLSGELTIDLEARPAVRLGAGELFVVPRGVVHCPSTDGECQLLLLEPAGVLNTGDADGARTGGGPVAVIAPPVRFDTKITVLLRNDLASWQRLNVTAFLVSGIAGTQPEVIGEPYTDADGTTYLPVFRQPVLVLAGDTATLAAARTRALARGLPLSIFTEELFGTTGPPSKPSPATPCAWSA